MFALFYSIFLAFPLQSDFVGLLLFLCWRLLGCCNICVVVSSIFFAFATSTDFACWISPRVGVEVGCLSSWRLSLRLDGSQTKGCAGKLSSNTQLRTWMPLRGLSAHLRCAIPTTPALRSFLSLSGSELFEPGVGVGVQPQPQPRLRGWGGVGVSPNHNSRLGLGSTQP